MRGSIPGQTDGLCGVPHGSAPLDWEAFADGVLIAVENRVRPLAAKMADEFYGRIMESVQDYLTSNLIFNINETLASAERESLRLRQANTALADRNAELLGVLKRIADGTYPPERRDTGYCPHGGFLSDECVDCITEFASAAIAEASSQDGQGTRPRTDAGPVPGRNPK